MGSKASIESNNKEIEWNSNFCKNHSLYSCIVKKKSISVHNFYAQRIQFCHKFNLFCSNLGIHSPLECHFSVIQKSIKQNPNLMLGQSWDSLELDSCYAVITLF